MKKILLASAAFVALAPAAFAQQATTTTTTTSSSSNTYYTNANTNNDGMYNSMLSGAYVGAFGGYGWTEAETAGADFDLDGADYGLFVGYRLDQFLQDNIGINGAIEAFYGWSDQDDDIAGASLDKDHEWGINFRPGLSFLSFGTSLNPYGIIGYRSTNFDASAGGLSDDENFDGMDLGLGTEVMAWGNIGMRVDYTHTFYEDKSGIDPDEDDIRVGLSYHF